MCYRVDCIVSENIQNLKIIKVNGILIKVNSKHTCDTPGRACEAFFWSPQFPVAREYFRPSVIIFVLMANSRLKSLPLSMNFCAYIRTSLVRFPEQSKKM